MEFLLFCIATVGMTLIITHGNIFAPFRLFMGDWAEQIRQRREQRSPASPRRSCVEWFSELINCAQCTGFWCGLFCGFLLVTPISFANSIESGLVWYRFFILFCCGLGGSFLATLGSNLIDWIFYHKMNALRKLEEHELILAQRRAELEQQE
ncbi:MAG: DUF1360 domain-containing protein [Planctomycetaceae bacterium]|nr:DUF1360 domain-containing protein [Planctomycetaceae bacterium]